MLQQFQAMNLKCAPSSWKGHGSLADEVKVDALGNVLVTRRGTGHEANLRVMLAAHMDEVGFMLVNDEEGGLFRFETVGRPGCAPAAR